MDELYNSIIPAGTFRASSLSVAEAAKVIEKHTAVMWNIEGQMNYPLYLISLI